MCDNLLLEEDEPFVDTFIREADKRAIDAIGSRFLNDPGARTEQVSEDYVTVEGRDYWMDDPVAVEARERYFRDQKELRQANRAILADWVMKHGTENQRERLQEGLLPWQEAYVDMTEHIFAPLLSFALYERFKIEDVCHHVREGDGACKVKFKSVDATTLTAEEWERYSQIRAAMPNATFQLREHTAACTVALEPEMKRGVIVKLSIKHLAFKREFALSEGAA